MNSEQLILKIRDYVNDIRLQYSLRQNAGYWNQLCSAMDVLEDTASAVNAYTERHQSNKYGDKYLEVYGLLQSLFTQQDALRHLCEALKITFNLKNYPRLQQIRNVRNKSVGHPTRTNRIQGETVGSHFISRISLSRGGFDLLSHYEDGTSNMQHISLIDAIADQTRLIDEILNEIIDTLEQKMQEHIGEYQDDRLSDVFPPTIGYHLSKISEGTRDYPSRVHALVNLQTIEGILQKLREKLAERGTPLDAYDSIKYCYEEIEYPMNQLMEFLSNSDSSLDPRTANIFAFFLRAKVNELQDMIVEIDEDYTITETDESK